MLENIIGGPVLERLDSRILTDGPRDEQERNLGPFLAGQCQRRAAVKTGHRVIREDDVNVSLLQRRNVIGAVIDAH